MRPISGFERPVLQWLFVTLAVILIAVAGGAAWMVRRANGTAETARTAEEAARLERQNLEAQVARERSMREALALELARAREAAGQPARVMPTLTLEPVRIRSAVAPEPTVAAQHATQVIELRLILPGAAKAFTRFEAVVRDWTSGRLVWSRGELTPTTVNRQPMLTTLVTGDLFRTGTYDLRVSGLDAGEKTQVAIYEIAFK